MQWIYASIINAGWRIFFCALYAIIKRKQMTDTIILLIFLVTKSQAYCMYTAYTLSEYAKCRCTENSGLSDGSHVSSKNVVVSAGD